MFINPSRMYTHSPGHSIPKQFERLAYGSPILTHTWTHTASTRTLYRTYGDTLQMLWRGTRDFMEHLITILVNSRNPRGSQQSNLDIYINLLLHFALNIKRNNFVCSFNFSFCGFFRQARYSRELQNGEEFPNVYMLNVTTLKKKKNNLFDFKVFKSVITAILQFQR